MANFSAGSGEMLTLSLLSVIPAAVAQLVTWIVYFKSSTNEKIGDNDGDSLTGARVIGTTLCCFVALGCILLFFIAAFGYFNPYWALVVLYICAVNPAVAYYTSLSLGIRYRKKHAPCHYKKPLLVIISSFVGVVLLGELLLWLIIEFFSANR